jgi:hypothetical protein
VYDALGIQKTPYELEREAMLSAGAQATEAARESERGVAATAGRVYAGQQSWSSRCSDTDGPKRCWVLKN